jgi:hypothetical protein
MRRPTAPTICTGDRRAHRSTRCWRFWLLCRKSDGGRALRERVRRNLILPGDVSFATDAAKEIPMTRLWLVLTIAAVLAGAAPAAAQQQPAPAPPDQGNGNWDPPPVTKPTTQR